MSTFSPSRCCCLYQRLYADPGLSHQVPAYRASSWLNNLEPVLVHSLLASTCFTLPPLSYAPTSSSSSPSPRLSRPETRKNSKHPILLFHFISPSPPRLSFLFQFQRYYDSPHPPIPPLSLSPFRSFAPLPFTLASFYHLLLSPWLTSVWLSISTLGFCSL
jgi:hypothetical protein